MPPRRRTPVETGRSAVRAWAADPLAAERTTLATAVRFTLEELSVRHPGGTCEVRVPPHGVVQCLDGPRHTRGTPPNVVQTDAVCWLELVTGRASWAQALAEGRVLASGERSDLSGVLPLLGETDIG